MALPPDGPAGPSRPDPDDPWPSSRAEIFIYLDSDERADRPRNRLLSRLRRLGPAKVGIRLAVPDAEADQMLRTLERMVLAVMWPFAVIGTLFGAGSAHLSPASATIVVVLEILVPLLVFRGRLRLADHPFGCGLQVVRVGALPESRQAGRRPGLRRFCIALIPIDVLVSGDQPHAPFGWPED